MSPDDPRHGTYAGAAAHWKERAPLCDPCRLAANRKRKRNKAFALMGNAATVPGTGTTRRIQALQTLGWTHSEIAAAAGLSVDAIRSPVYRGTMVYRATADGVARAFDQLAMKIAPDSRNSRYCRTAAARKGYAPPLAWDNIDDPNERPTIGAPDAVAANGGRSIANLLEDAEWLADGDAALSEVIERLDVKLDTFRDTCARAGRSDLYWRLARREPDGELRWEVSQGLKRSKSAVA